MILGQFSLILPGDFGQMVLTKFGLEKEISGIGVVAQDPVHGTLVKDAATLGGIPFLVELLDNGGSSFSIQIVPKDSSDNIRFFRYHHQLAVLSMVSQHEEAPWNALLKVAPDPPLLIFTGGEAFFLGIACQDGEHQFSVGGGGIDGLFFKIYADAQAFQFPDGFQKSHGVAGKAGNGLGDDVVYFACPAVGEHPLEVLTAVPGTGLGFVGVNAHILPAVMVADVGAVMIHLGRQGVKHGILAAGHSGVCRHPEGLGHPGCKLDLFYGSWHGILLCNIYCSFQRK